MGIERHLHLYGNRGIAAEGIHHFNASSVFARSGVGVARIADGFEAAILAEKCRVMPCKPTLMKT
jgi:hypothetical protein